MSNDMNRRQFLSASALVAAVVAEEASAGFLGIRGRNRKHTTLAKKDYQEISIPQSGTFYIFDNPEGKQGAIFFDKGNNERAIVPRDYFLVPTEGSIYRPLRDTLEKVADPYMIALAEVKEGHLTFYQGSSGHQTSIISAGTVNLKVAKKERNAVIDSEVKRRIDRIPSIQITQKIDGRKRTDEFYTIPIGKDVYENFVKKEHREKVLPVVLLAKDMEPDPLIHRDKDGWKLEHRYQGRAYLIGKGKFVDKPIKKENIEVKKVTEGDDKE